MSAMGRLHKWISFYLFIYIVLQDASCQSNTLYEETRFHPTTPDLLCELSKEFSSPNSAKTQLMNTLLSVAASKGVLPELASALQPTLSFEKSQQPATTPQPPPQTSSPKTFSYIPFAPGYPQDYVPVHNLQNQPVALNTNTGRPCTTVNEIIPQAIQQPSIQVMPLDSYFNALNCGCIQPAPITCQPQQPEKDMCVRPLPIPSSDISFPYSNPQIGQPTAISQPTKVSLGNTEHICPHLVTPQVQYSNVWNYDNETSPLKVEIKIAPPNATEPARASKEQPLINPNIDLPSECLSLPQILITKSKSRSSIKKLLPALILAMLLDDHDDGNGCSCCEADSNKFIPIPYPIPIPINNLIMKVKPKTDSSEDESHEDHDENNC